MPFDIKIKQESYGPMVIVNQYDTYGNACDVLTIQETEQLRNRLTETINSARNILNSKVKFKIGSGN